MAERLKSLLLSYYFMPTVAELGEREVINRIMHCLTVMPNMPIPVWDDVNAISLGGGFCVVLKTDMLVWKTDIPQGMTPFQAGRKAVIMNFSDLGSKGCQPQAFLAALGVPESTPISWVEDIAHGFESAVREHEAYMVGGDTNEACDIIISGMAYGTAEESKLVKRGTSKPGDILCSSGSWGNTTCAFKILLEDLEVRATLRDKLLQSVYMPHTRVKAGIELANSGAATSSMDSSDGLAVSLHDLEKSSGNGFIIEKLPLTSEATFFVETHNLDPSATALYGGEEYELVFTVDPKQLDNARSCLKKAGCELQILGRVIREKKIVYIENGIEKKVGSGGWEHFTGLK